MSDKRSQNESLLSERLIMAALTLLAAILWAAGQISFLGMVVISGVAILLLAQLHMKRRWQAMQRHDADRQQAQADTSPQLKNVRAAALYSVPTPIVLVDRSHQVVLANQAAYDLLGTDIDGQDVFLYLRQSDIIDAVQAALREEQSSHLGALRFATADERSFDITVETVAADPTEVDADAARQAMIFFFEVTSQLRSERMRVDFVANASHELRTPLSTVLGSIETLQGPAADDPDAQKRFLHIMQRESERMVHLIDDLLSLSRIEMSRHKLPEKPVDLANLIENAVLLQKDAAERRGIDYAIRLPDGLPPVRADEDQLMQVMINLLHNAAKYAIENSTVSIEARHDPQYGDVRLSVHDQGPGIAPEHLGRLTERFYRVDNARSRKMGGTGLGLAIVKHILLRHRSNLEIKSQLGVGTSFSFRLSVFACPAPENTMEPVAENAVAATQVPLRSTSSLPGGDTRLSGDQSVTQRQESVE